MKKILLTTTMALALMFSVNAQEKAKQVFLHDPAIMTELGLSPEQQKKILEIRKLTDPQIREIRANTSLDAAEQKKQLVKAYSERTKMQNEVLTPEQIKQLALLRKKAKEESAN